MPRPFGLRDRILAWYGGTVLAVLGVVLVLVDIKVNDATSQHVAGQMETTRRVVLSLQRERTETLAIVAGVAGDEPRLGAAMAGASGQSSATISNLLQDLLPRFKADFIRVTDAHGLVLADTSGRVHARTDLSADEAVHTALAGKVWKGMQILPAEIDLVATSRIYVGGQDLGTVTVGRRVSDEMANELNENTGSEVTFFAGRELAASSWPAQARSALPAAVQSAPRGVLAADGTRSFPMTLAGQRLRCLLIPLIGRGSARGTLLVQSSLDAALRPIASIQRALAIIGLMGLLLAVLGSVIVAGGVTRPLHRITHAAHGLMQGDWRQRAPVTSQDEVGLLAGTFNRMAERLESWDSDMRAAVAERTRELNAAVAQLDVAFQQMRQFNADASHELRTPLTVIRGEAEVALRAARSAQEYQQVLRTIQEETERMSRIIEQLLLLARADSGELRLERRPIALDDLVREVAHRAEVLAQARRIRLRTETLEPMLLEGDEDRLGQLTLNLIDNAIKYTPEGGEVRIRLQTVAAEGAWSGKEACLEVEDTGIGIDAEALPHIFDRFYRVDKARSRSVGGSGLGLAICRWIVEAHGGRIDVRSRPGIGSTLVVRLPGAVSPAVDGSPTDILEVSD